jgi:hypothetical protein
VTSYTHEPFIDSHCPPKHRFLAQIIEPETTEDAARQAVRRIFGRSYAEKVVLVKGIYRSNMKSHAYKTSDPWDFEPDGGWMAFVPGLNKNIG